MTNLERMQLRTNEPDDSILLDCLESAKNAILARRYPYGDWPTKEIDVTVPPVMGTDPDTGEPVIVEPGHTEKATETVLELRYLDLQYRIAIDLYNKAGAEGELSHSENGVSRGYESSWISQQLLNEVVPMVVVVS